LLASLLLSTVILAGCGSTNGDEDAGGGSDASSSGPQVDTASESPTPTKATEPTYRSLGKPALTKALIGVQDLPPGYSQDPPSEDANKTFCNYKPPFTEKIKASRDFTKGGGLSAEFLSVGIRQYATAQQAKAAFKALADTLATCTTETDEGTKYTYALTSTAKVGEAQVGVKISTDGASGLSNFALVGPALINVGGGGVMNVDADTVTAMLRAQVKAYTAAAQQ
jgi:hypothetical protein